MLKFSGCSCLSSGRKRKGSGATAHGATVDGHRQRAPAGEGAGRRGGGEGDRHQPHHARRDAPTTRGGHTTTNGTLRRRHRSRDEPTYQAVALKRGHDQDAALQPTRRDGRGPHLPGRPRATSETATSAHRTRVPGTREGGRGGAPTLRQTCPRHRPRAQGAFKDSMVHGILQFTLRIAFRCVLHRYGSLDIRC